jgi:HlyD family type I secretion membrane fusion protein
VSPKKRDARASREQESDDASEDASSSAKRPAMQSARLATRENEAYVDIGASSDGREFLLAERPRLVRATLYLSLLLLAAGIAWASLGTVDVVVSAPGIVRPQGDTVQIQAPVGGVVTEVLVREGSSVAADEVILRFDPKPLRLERDRVVAAIDAKRREKANAEDARQRLAASFAKEKETRETETEQARIQVELEKTRRDNAVRQAKARLEIAEAHVRATRIGIAEQEKNVAAVQARVKAEVLTQVDLEREQHQLERLRAELDPNLKEVESAQVACEADETQVKLSEGNLAQRKKLADEMPAAFAIKDGAAEARISQIEGEKLALEAELKGVDLKIQNVELRAPFGGLVTRLAVTHAGRVVPEGSTIAELSPRGHELVLEAYVKDSDIGTLKQGIAAQKEKLPVKLRFAAFKYEEYGALEGEVIELAPDSVRQPADSAGGISPDAPVYKVTISMKKLDLVNNRGKSGRIELGMAAQADIVVDERPLIYLVLNELQQFFDLRKR